MAIDFALTPTGDAALTDSFGGLLKVRPDTTLLGPAEFARSIQSFLDAVASTTGAIGNLVLTSHAAPTGSLSLLLTDTSSDTVDYDNLTAQLKTRPGVVRASVPVLNRLVANAGIIVKGCDLGRSPEFMTLLQTAIGPRFGVIASLYPHAAGEDADNGGWIEFMLYEFYQDYFLSKDSRFDALDTTKVKALTKAGIIADMKANPLNKQYNGSDFPAKAWDAMIPIMPSLKVGKLPKPTPKLFTAKFPTAWGLKPTALRKAELGGLLEIERFEVASVMLGIWTISGSAAPSNKSPIADRRAYILSKLATDPGHQPSAPYPMYKRYGFANLADFVNHFDWGNVSGDTWTAKTWRFIKTVPITDPTTGELVCNHYGTTPPRRALLETNGGLFAAVAAAP